ncbi:MAG TPA: peptidylprolyl isomerase [Povalibacter sp.]|uniref:peptidylprolyl isomerase n=1 Tax=Povalibacter sp. TaxID=1962978 RepID=UPI002BC84BDA|nr:peptidylprolyl isomerase [Povalibacter sp.]HMN43744.1 peptidylprolyl isomerase [Povalibacter sp.]
MKRWLREPLLHFLLLAVCAFALYGWVSTGPAPRDGIVVSAAQVENLVATFERTWQRPPSAAELQHLIDRHVRDEVMYREGVALGLDADDVVIRRRVQQKMQFLMESDEMTAPTEAQLQAYLSANPDRYRTLPRYSFTQVFIDLRRHPDAQRHAREVLQTLTRSTGAESAAHGDATLLPVRFEDTDTAEIDRTIGADFTAQLQPLALDTWHGPLRSSYGLHLVLITAKQPALPASFDEVRDVLARDWSDEQRRLSDERGYRAMRERYSVRVDLPQRQRLADAATPGN